MMDRIEAIDVESWKPDIQRPVSRCERVQNLKLDGSFEVIIVCPYLPERIHSQIYTGSRAVRYVTGPSHSDANGHSGGRREVVRRDEAQVSWVYTKKFARV